MNFVSVVVVPGTNRPHESMLLGVSVPLGVGILLTAPAPQSVIALWPHWFVQVWAAALAASGVAGLVALHWKKRPVRALQVEAGALIVNAAGLALFAAAAITVNGTRAWFPASFFAAWTVANLVRSHQIRRSVRRSRAITFTEQ